MPFNTCDFDRCFQNIVQCDDVIIRKVQDENIRFEGFTRYKSSQLKFHIINHTHCYEIWSCWMELDACNSFVFTVIVFKIRSWLKSSTVDSSTCCSFFISKNLEIVLENIDNFVRLKGLFNSESDSINELIKFFI